MFKSNTREYNAPDCSEYVVVVDEVLCGSFNTPTVEEVEGDFTWN